MSVSSCLVSLKECAGTHPDFADVCRERSMKQGFTEGINIVAESAKESLQKKTFYLRLLCHRASSAMKGWNIANGGRVHLIQVN